MNVEAWTSPKRDFLNEPGHVLALGGPGSGKTHVALIKARTEIQKGTLLPGQQILFLSFARPTVARIIEKAKELVGKVELARVEISTYHAFAWSVLRSHSYLLNNRAPLRLLAPPEGAALLADVSKEDQEAEKRRLFHEEGRLHFDLFARLVAELLARSKNLARIYSDAYPTIIVDEFQDTNADEWAMVRELGRLSRLIALADPEQRIYEFRGAEASRLRDFDVEFNPLIVIFEGENYRSAGTDIAAYGADLITGRNKGKTYNDVDVVEYGFYHNRSQHYQAKVQLIKAIKRVRQEPSWSVALLVPSKSLMLQASDYLISQDDNLPSINHDVAMDAEAPALAASVIATILEGGAPEQVVDKLLQSLHTHIRGRTGSKRPAQGELELADFIAAYLKSRKVRGQRRKVLIEECLRIAEARRSMQLAGNPEEDWLAVRSLLAHSSSERVSRVADDAKFLRLLHKGASLRMALSELWKTQGNYVGANSAVRNALLQEHFSSALKEWRGVHLMTIHKAKGKEFDEVIVYEGRRIGRIVPEKSDPSRQVQARLALHVAVTRAIRRATIVTPRGARCIFV